LEEHAASIFRVKELPEYEKMVKSKKREDQDQGTLRDPVGIRRAV
jgi:hypothetical protein